MKRILSMVLIMSLTVFAFAGCSDKPAETTEDTPAVTENAVKTGLAVISSAEKSVDAADEDGIAQVDSVAVAVMVDADGKILKAEIDTAQTKVNFSKEGKLTTDKAMEFKSKQELGTEYGMAAASTIGKDWAEQANAFETFVEGKTVEEIKTFSLDEETHLTDADMTASVTIKVGPYIEAIEKAVTNAQDIGASATDKLGLGLETTIEKSADFDAAESKDGLAQVYTYYTASTFAEDGVITSSLIDASQTNINFDATGKITTDLTAALQSKNELGDAYGMKSASSIGKEWNEQADAFSKYVVGKTSEEVSGIAVDADGHATDADVTASVTVGIAEFQTVVAKAFATAK
ncbi:hypothetical protein [Proteocatella sphenisci]|uniref:hypothetical protein n=1 Tax=Proteocatella sphenisci TaxID=181070 RepID=UPI00048B2325|nr:hypothetical protein [Proteocatella sphenisci]